jgi:hypothetical protein
MRTILAMVVLFTILPLVSCQAPRYAGPQMVATYDKSGGIAGLNQRLIVRSDGSMLLHDRRAGVRLEALVDPGTIEPLVELVHSAEFAGARRLYPGDPGGADLMTYTIEAQLPARRHTVTTMDSAQPPEIVQRVIDELERLAQITRERGRPT